MPLTVTRYDRGKVYKAELTDEGYLRAHAIVTRTGVFDYINPDGTKRKELRHPSDVFNPQSLKSMKMRPITDGHPESKLVDAGNVKSLQAGFTGEEVNVDGPYVSTSLLITDPKLISEVMQRKKTELSLGYHVDLIEDKGKFDGEAYTHRQTNIRYNHLAVVDKGRAGPEARIQLDASAAIEEDSLRNDYQETNLKKEIDMPEEIKLPNVNIDGLSYPAAPEVINAFKKKSERIDELKAKVTSYKADIEKLKAERDNLSQKMDETKKINIDEMIKDGVKKRVALIDDVKLIMSKKANELNLDSLSDKEMKVIVVKEKCPNVDIDKASDVYLDARFDALKETAIENAGSKKESDNFGEQRKKVIVKYDSKEKEDKVDTARERMMSRMYGRKDKHRDSNGYGRGNTSNELDANGYGRGNTSNGLDKRDTYGRNQGKSYEDMFCNK